MQTPVSIIIIAADSGPSLRECVLRALASSVPVEVIVADNGSRDGVPQALARACENDARVRVLYNHANLGFGPAVNRAAHKANGNALLVLNPDCMLDGDTLARLLDVLATHPGAGVVGVVVCSDDGTPDPASRRRDPLLRRSLNQMSGRAAREAEDPKFEGVNVPGPIPDKLIEAENISGALMLLPRAAFDHLQGFDEGYFLHCEDLDLCRRARDAGYQVLLAGDVRVHHGKGGSSRHRPVFVSYHKHRGMWRWFRKFDPAARKPLTRAVVWCGLTGHFFVSAPKLWLRRATRH
ncbi:MAG TPA: glycosyltransferase family 2 protein [Rhodanobacteraceae bacterium]|jgi:GT2 family glycosyltransferase|nr:glycosyltransferase family 2 protein [Rhodanobacteraceae bacterium]